MRLKRKHSVNSCPCCRRKPIHAHAIAWPLLDLDGEYGWDLKLECPKHGWQDKGSGWYTEELVEAGLKP